MADPHRFKPLTLGERLVLVVSSTGVSDFTAVPVTLVLDGPQPAAGEPRVRHVLRWLNGGGDGVLVPGNAAVRFEKSSAWTAANLTPGEWTVRLLTGDAATVQDEIGYGTKRVARPSGGPLPTT